MTITKFLVCCGTGWVVCYLSRIQKIFFENFEKRWRTNSFFCPHSTSILKFLVCTIKLW